MCEGDVVGAGERYVDEGKYGYVCAGRWTMDCGAWSRNLGILSRSITHHLPLGTTVIDANGRCTQRYDGASLTGVCMDHRSSGLVQSLLLPLLQAILKYLTGSRTWPST